MGFGNDFVLLVFELEESSCTDEAKSICIKNQNTVLPFRFDWVGCSRSIHTPSRKESFSTSGEIQGNDSPFLLQRTESDGEIRNTMVAGRVSSIALQRVRPSLVRRAVLGSAALDSAVLIRGFDLNARADVAHQGQIVSGSLHAVGVGVAVLEHSLGQVLRGDGQVGFGGETHADAVVVGGDVGGAGWLDDMRGGLLGEDEGRGHSVGGEREGVGAVVVDRDGEVGGLVAGEVAVLVSVLVRDGQGGKRQERSECQLGEHLVDLVKTVVGLGRGGIKNVRLVNRKYVSSSV